MLIKRNSAILAALASLVLISTACSGGKGGETVSPYPGKSEQVKQIDMTKPVELTFYSDNATYPTNDKDFMEDFGQYIQKKYPNITFKNNIYSAQTKQGLAQTIAAGTNFDLAKASAVQLYNYVDLQVSSDISDLIKKYNFNLSAIDPNTIQLMKNAAKDQLIGLPYQTNAMIMFYNKAIFDKFGLPFPKDGMTWDDVTEVVRKVTRVDGGVQYIGLGNQPGWR